MKFKHYLETIAGVDIFPLFSLVVFFVFFIILLWYVIAADKNEIQMLKNLPLDQVETKLYSHENELKK
jgi:cytochrome c oxidase cbb3-type subunit 3